VREQRRYDDSGMTLVEMLVSIVLLSVLGGLVLAATLATQRSLRLADDETRGQEDVVVVVDRLGRDIRDARGVVCDGASYDPFCTNHLQLWADYNSNYKQDPGETITWALRAGPDGEHFDVVRSTDGGPEQVVGRTIVSDVAFEYSPPAYPPGPSQPAPGVPTTNEVLVNMTYDALRESGTDFRTVEFSAMLRNVP
jgi:prepilin-type N-terminal cleavage/methylation domain-containing protein